MKKLLAQSIKFKDIELMPRIVFKGTPLTLTPRDLDDLNNWIQSQPEYWKPTEFYAEGDSNKQYNCEALDNTMRTLQESITEHPAPILIDLFSIFQYVQTLQKPGITIEIELTLVSDNRNAPVGIWHIDNYYMDGEKSFEKHDPDKAPKREPLGTAASPIRENYFNSNILTISIGQDGLLYCPSLELFRTRKTFPLVDTQFQFNDFVDSLEQDIVKQLPQGEMMDRDPRMVHKSAKGEKGPRILINFYGREELSSKSCVKQYVKLRKETETQHTPTNLPPQQKKAGPAPNYLPAKSAAAAT